MKPVTLLGLLMTTANATLHVSSVARVADLARVAGSVQENDKRLAVAALILDVGKLRYDLNSQHGASGTTLVFDKIAIGMDVVGQIGGKRGTVISAIYSLGDLALPGGWEGQWNNFQQERAQQPPDAAANCGFRC
jgi:hypothetical protein